MARRTCVYEALTAHGMKECGLPEDLPIIVVIAYHGRRNWTATLNRENMNPARGAIARLRSTRHRYYLCDLYRMSERKMAEDPVLRAGLSMSTCAFRKSVTVEEIARLLEPFPSGSQLEEMALAYIIRLPASFATLVEGVRRAKSRRGVEIMESVYESLSRKIDLGREEGRAEGRAEERVRTMLVMLKGRFGDLPAAVVSQLKAATPEQLDEWAAELLLPGRAERLFRNWESNGRSPASLIRHCDFSAPLPSRLEVPGVGTASRGGEYPCRRTLTWRSSECGIAFRELRRTETRAPAAEFA